MPEILPAAPARQPWADTAIPVTLFVDVHAREGRVHERWITPRALARMIGEARAREKARLPLLKLARFGDVPTPKGSLRHDANVTAVTGVEADYDGEATSFDDACEVIRRAGVAAILYTSPSHSETRPRWRVLCPFAVDGPETAGLPPARRETMMRRLAGLFARSGAELAPESWTLSQAYYYGGVVNGEGRGPRVELIEGATIDRRHDLDDAAVSSPKEAQRAARRHDESRSGIAFRIGARMRREGGTFDDMCDAIRREPATADWFREKGTTNDGRELRRIWDRAGLRPAASAGQQGKRQRNTLALVSSLTDQSEWRGALAVNELTETIEIALRFQPAIQRCDRRPLADNDVLEAMLSAQARDFPKATKGQVLDALTVIAHRNAYHPVRDYLTALRWDGVARVNRLFFDYFPADLPKPPAHPPAEEQPARGRPVAYLEQIGARFMLSAVARVMQPGCKVDHVPVLIGAKGIGKSSALRALCRDPIWFTDDVSPNLVERDTKESLRGKWLVELAEIPHVRKEVERVKAFFTRREDRYREAYGMLNRDHPRQCVFVGTSNHIEFADATGNRRFWPVRLTDRRIDLGRIERDRDQLWAEAVALYRDGMTWWLPPHIEAIAAEMQEDFNEADLWEEAIDRWAESRTTFTLADLFAAQSGFMPFREAAAATKADQMRAARCLTKLGFHKRYETRDGRRSMWWRRKTQGFEN